MKTKNILSVIYAIFLTACLISCDTPRTNKVETIEFDAVVIKKVLRPEYVSDRIEFESDSSISYLAQKYYPEEYELYAQDNNGEIYKFTEKNLSSEVFHNFKLKDTGRISRSVEKKDKILYDTIITDFDCIVLEKYYYPERIEIDTHKVKTDNFYRDEIVEVLHQEKSFVKGIRIDNNEIVEVVVQSYERIKNIRMCDTVSCFQTEYNERHK